MRAIRQGEYASAGDSKYNDILGLDVDINEAPFLSSLTLTTNFEFHLPLGTQEDEPYFPLRRLELKHCPRVMNKLLEDVFPGLSRDGTWGT